MFGLCSGRLWKTPHNVRKSDKSFYRREKNFDGDKDVVDALQAEPRR